MVEKPVCQTGLTRIVRNFAIKTQRGIFVLVMETNFAFSIGFEKIVMYFAIRPQPTTNV